MIGSTVSAFPGGNSPARIRGRCRGAQRLNTFPVDLFTREAARDALGEIVDKVWLYCERSGIRGRTVTLKVKFSNFQQITRSRTGQTQIGTRSDLEQLGNKLLEPLFPVTRGIRFLGISLSSLTAKETELDREFSLPL